MSITIRPRKKTHKVWTTYVCATSYTTCTHIVVRQGPKQCVLHCSLLVSLWEWFVGKVGELTLRWADNNRISKNTFYGSHGLSVWLITPRYEFRLTGDWTTLWQLETHNAMRTVHKDDKTMVRPSVVSLSGKDALLSFLQEKRRVIC